MIPNLSALTAKLLPGFISDKLNTYVEPTKKGTPKGDPVGFSRTKYTATLYALRGRVLAKTEDLVAQAEELGVSYGLLRKWRSEEKFKELVSQHQKEFTAYVLRSSDPRAVIKGALPSLGARLDVLRGAGMAESRSRRTEESVRKLLILLHANIQDELKKSEVSPSQLRKYQLLALDHAIEVLSDRRAAATHRKDIMNLLAGVRETLG